MKPLLLWLVLAQLGDGVSTHVAIHRGCREANVIAAPHVTTALLVKSGATIACAIAVPLEHRTRPRLASGLAATVAAVGTAATAWNVAQLTRGCR